VAVTKDQVEQYYSRLPFLKRPKDILVLKNADVQAERLYAATHQYNAGIRMLASNTPAGRMNYRLYGMYRPGTDYIMVSGDADPTTVIHEAVHFSGVPNEQRTRFLTQLLARRANMSRGILTRPAHYSEARVSPQDAEEILRGLGMSNPSGAPVELVHLVYTPS
jgi:hypothetical protein